MVDVIIVGQGLAGTTLAWLLQERGSSVLILDREPATTSSRIAAGLITPITGKRLAKTWRIDELFPVAETFYRRIEARLGLSLFHHRQTVRLFQDAEEQRVFAARSAPDYLRWVESNPEPLPAGIQAPLGSFCMTSAQLAVSLYLDSSRRWFRERNQYQQVTLHLYNDLQLGADLVRIPRLGLEARKLIFCTGFIPGGNPWFHGVRFFPAKGEILTVEIPGLNETRILNRGGTWLAPLGEGRFRTGSTYDRDNLDCVPTAAGCEEILRHLREFIDLPIRVLEHHAGIRPIIDEGKPAWGLHPQHPQLGFFNGLASKGSIYAPFFAAEMLRELIPA